MGAPEAKAIMRADNRRLRSDLAKSKQMFGRTFSRIGAGIRGTMTSALGALGVGGGIAGLASIGKEVSSFEDTLSRLEIQSGASAEKMGAIREQIIALSKDTGTSRNQIAGAAKALVDLFGGAALTEENLRLLVDANLATGAAMEDLAGLSLTLQNAFGLTGAEQLEKGLNAVTKAGKEGSIPINDMAVALRKVGAIFADVSGRGPKGAAQLAAAMQVLAAQGFANADDSATGLQRAMLAIQVQSKQLKKLGVDVFKKDGKTFKDLPDIADELNRAGATIAALKKQGLDIRAARGLAALAKGAGDFRRLSKEAQKEQTIQIDKAKRMDSVAQKLTKRFNALKETLFDLVTPERLEAFAEVLGKIGKLVGFIADNAKAFVAAWATLRLGGVVAQMVSVAASAKAAEAASVGTAAGLSRAAKSMGVLAALGAGFTLGTLLDEATGASNKISDAAVAARKGSKAFQGQAFLRERSEEVGRGAGLGALGFGGFVDQAELLRDANALITQSKAAGVIGKGGEVDPLQAARVTTKGEIGQVQQRLFETGAQTSPAQQALTRNIEAAQQIVAEAAKGQRVEVVVRVDQDGRISASGSGTVE